MRRVTGTALAWCGLVALSSALPIVDRVVSDDRPAAQQKTGPRVYKGRVIAPVMTAEGGGAEWLERRDRDATEQPEKVLDALQIPPGSTIADIGAGTGYYSLRIAKRIGAKGRVLATDVQPEMIRLLTENAKKAGLKHVEPILCTETDAKLPNAGVDLALMVDVYHELQDPEGTMAQIRRALKSGGRLVLVEYRAEDPTVPIRPEHKTTLRQIRYEIEPMGFRLKEVFEFLPHQHVEVFVKDDVQGEDEIVDPAGFPAIRKPGWAGVGAVEPYAKAGFKSLFDGKTLAGWKGKVTGWSIHDGGLKTVVRSDDVASPKETEESFDDFELDLLWRLKDAESSAAVCLRNNPRLCVRLDSGVPHAEGYPETIAARRTGEVTNAGDGRVIRPANDTLKAVVLPGEWNRLTIRCIGRRVAIAVNGVTAASFESGQGDLRAPIGLQAVQGEAEFRDIWLLPLEKSGK